jgi:putative addiction module killer protein
MKPVARQILNYQTPDGTQPFQAWFDGLRDAAAQGIALARLERVKAGNLGNCKSVGHGVMELKIDFGPGYRIYFGQDGSTLVILLCGGDKASQTRDVNDAQEYWADYEQRKG